MFTLSRVWALQVREGDILDNRVTHPDVDVAFTRNAHQTGGGSGAGAGSGSGTGRVGAISARMGYSDFIAAMTELAHRKYGGDDKAAAFRRLLTVRIATARHLCRYSFVLVAGTHRTALCSPEI
jgi:hypothetical protein